MTFADGTVRECLAVPDADCHDGGYYRADYRLGYRDPDGHVGLAGGTSTDELQAARRAGLTDRLLRNLRGGQWIAYRDQYRGMKPEDVFPAKLALLTDGYRIEMREHRSDNGITYELRLAAAPADAQPKAWDGAAPGQQLTIA